MPNPDQRLTQDIDKFSTALARFYSNVSKPVLDVALFSRKLAEQIGWEGPVAVIGWYFLSGVIIKFISPAFSKHTVVEQELEGEYRACQSDLINYSEEITFYRGHNWEQRRSVETFDRLRDHIHNTHVKRFFMGIFDNVLVRYGATIVAVSVLALPVFGPKANQYMAQTSGDTSKIT